MDDIDRKIIKLLVADGRTSVTDLADAVHLSLSAASQRLRRLQESGAIERFTVRLGGPATGRPVEALVDLQLSPGAPWEGIDHALREQEDVVDAVHLTGGFDYQIRIRSRSIEELDNLLRWLKESMGVRETSTRIVLHTVEGFPREAID
ncbi:Lrp/AsnC family transcriptional regulator [Actinospongicola halichondriae]|uniref:Lrp/AsnC family transcriptional regulator n=1 Tax=Actinospongicola halichondriae TaxID=3236844 RepID=UPI003D5C5983